MQLEDFPQNLVIHPEERKVERTDIPMTGQRWIPDAKNGDFQEWLRILLHSDSDLLRAEDVLALPVRFQRCVADNRGGMKKLFGTNPYKSQIRYSDRGPVGENGTMKPAGILDNKAQDGLLVWSRKRDQLLQRALIQTLFGTRDPKDLQKSWLVTGDPKALVRHWVMQLPPRPSEFMQVPETCALYDRAMARASAVIPDEPVLGSPWAMQRLSVLKKFHREMILWATLDGDAIRSLQSGRNFAWYVALPPDHPVARTQNHTFTAHGKWGMNALSIKPSRFTEVWAGLAATHEDGHLYDIYSKAEKHGSSRAEYLAGEVRAYEPEILLADLLSKGAFTAALDRVITELGLASRDTLLEMQRKRDPRLQRISEIMDPVLTSEEPQSEGELATRTGLYLMAIAFRLTDRRLHDETSRSAEHARDVEAVMSSTPEGAAVLPRR